MFQSGYRTICTLVSWSTKRNYPVNSNRSRHPCDSMATNAETQMIRIGKHSLLYHTAMSDELQPTTIHRQYVVSRVEKNHPHFVYYPLSLQKAIERRAWSKWNFHSKDISFFVRQTIAHRAFFCFSFSLCNAKKIQRKMSCTRSHVLRQQKSCVISSGANVAGLNYRERRFQLQKQFSFDQGQNVRHYVCHRGGGGGDTATASMDIESKNNTFAKIQDVLPEASLQVFNAFNAKPSHGNGDHETYVIPMEL